MTSSDIYYRLGRIESNIEALQTDVKDLKEGQTRLENKIEALRKESKEEHQAMRSELKAAIVGTDAKIENVRVELKDDMTDFRAESKEEHQAIRSDLKGEITSLKRTVDKLSTQVQQIATNQTKTDSKIDAFLWVNGVIFGVLTLVIAWKTLKETRKANSEQKEQKSEVSPLFNLDAIKSLIDYYKNN